MNEFNIKNRYFITALLTYSILIPIFASVTYAGGVFSKESEITDIINARALIQKSAENNFKMSRKEAQELAHKVTAGGGDYVNGIKSFLRTLQRLKVLSKNYPIEDLKNILLSIKATQNSDHDSTNASNIKFKSSVLANALQLLPNNLNPSTTKEIILQHAKELATTLDCHQYLNFIEVFTKLAQKQKKNSKKTQIAKREEEKSSSESSAPLDIFQVSLKLAREAKNLRDLLDAYKAVQFTQESADEVKTFDQLQSSCNPHHSPKDEAK